jgi:superfamily I DNA/RNA helicase
MSRFARGQSHRSGYSSPRQTRQYLLETVKRWTDEVAAEQICLAVRTERQIEDRTRPLLEHAGLEVTQVQTDPESEAKQPGVRIATMHRLKGLEFPV